MPESPRWLLTHGHVQAAIATVERIEAAGATADGRLRPVEAAVDLAVAR